MSSAAESRCQIAAQLPNIDFKPRQGFLEFLQVLSRCLRFGNVKTHKVIEAKERFYVTNPGVLHIEYCQAP